MCIAEVGIATVMIFVAYSSLISVIPTVPLGTVMDTVTLAIVPSVPATIVGKSGVSYRIGAKMEAS